MYYVNMYVLCSKIVKDLNLKITQLCQGLSLRMTEENKR